MFGLELVGDPEIAAAPGKETSAHRSTNGTRVRRHPRARIRILLPASRRTAPETGESESARDFLS